MATIDSTVAFKMWWCTMYSLLLLLPALFPVKASVSVYDEKMTAVNFKGIRFSFRLRGDTTSKLNGQFKVEHDDCENKVCGKTTDFQGGSFHYPIYIHTVLNPCKNHTEIQIKAVKYELDGGGAMVWRRNWVAVNCSKSSETITTEANEMTNQPANNTANFFTVKSFQNSIILSVALFVIISSAATISVCIICKKKSEEKRKRNETMETVENPMYGTYEDGPLYNIVTDENAYYSS